MKFLLPHRFKRLGAVVAPLGLIIWILMQMRLVHKLIFALTGIPGSNIISQQTNVVILSTAFFSFLFGLYFLTFSKEKIEDEMIVQKRVESFQFAAVIQFFLIILGFVLMLLIREPDKEGLLLYFAAIIFIFWLSFICRFNIVLYLKFKNEK
jgi:ABC-type spermidine/putrescine transport system permease subunit I